MSTHNNNDSNYTVKFLHCFLFSKLIHNLPQETQVFTSMLESTSIVDSTISS